MSELCEYNNQALGSFLLKPANLNSKQKAAHWLIFTKVFLVTWQSEQIILLLLFLWCSGILVP